MATDMEKWANRQITAATERGVHPLDAARAMREFLATVPADADPSTYIRPAFTLDETLASESVVEDSRAAWYSEVDARYARLLDAQGED